MAKTLKKIKKKVKKVVKKVALPVAALAIPGVAPLALKAVTTVGGLAAPVAKTVATSVVGAAISTKIAGKTTVKQGEIAIVDEGKTATAIVDDKPIATSNFVIKKTGQIIPVESLASAKDVKKVLAEGGQILTANAMQQAINKGIKIPKDVQQQVISQAVTPAEYIIPTTTEPEQPTITKAQTNLKKLLPFILIGGVGLLLLPQLIKKESKGGK